MSLQTSIDAVAKQIALAEPTDLAALVALQEALQDLAEEAAGASLGPVHDVSAQAAELVERLVLREVDDVALAMRSLADAIEFAQSAQQLVDRGESLADLRSPFATDQPSSAPAEPRQSDFIAAWLEQCRSLRARIMPLLARITPASPDATATCRAVAAELKTLADESRLAGLGAAESLLHGLQRALETPLPLEDLADLLSYGLAWIDDASTLLRANADAVLPEIDRSLFNHVAAIPTAEAPPSTPPDDTGDSNAEIRFDTATDPASLSEFVVEAREHLALAEKALLALERNPRDVEEINSLFRAFHTIKGVAGFLNLAPIVHFTHHAETLLDRVRAGSLPITPTLLSCLLSARDLLAQLIEQLMGGPRVKLAAVTGLARQLANDFNATGSPTAAAPPARAAETTDRSDARKDARVEPRPASEPAPPTVRLRSEQVVKVTTERLDSLLDLMGELVIAELMIIQDPLVERIADQRVHRNIAHLTRIVRELHAVAMCLRMESLKSTFQRMARLVRDLRTRSGKAIELVLEGEDTELDRTIVSEIADPLVHMVRNACDHGIEPGEERIRAGKPASGTLTLRAFHLGGHISIEIEDDGRGLQRERILKKCLERGLIAPDRKLDDIPDADVWNFILLPGFSTAETITDISGRGVGMDVVKRNIEALHGKLDIRSTPGRGTTFTIQLPLTTAIIDGMIVRVGAQRYVIPLLAIERPFKPDATQIQTVLGRGEIVNYRGESLPIHRLDRIFGIVGDCANLTDGILLAIDNGGHRSCIAVDEIVGQQQVVIKTLGEDRWRAQGVSGGAILGDGRVALILDVNTLLDGSHSNV